MNRLVRSLVALAMIVSQSACLGTIVQAPTGQGASYGDTRVHWVSGTRCSSHQSS